MRALHFNIQVFSSVLMANVMRSLSSMQEEDVLEHTDGHCHLRQLVDDCETYICMHLVSLLNKLMPR